MVNTFIGILGLTLFFVVGLILAVWPSKVQAWELKNLPDPEKPFKSGPRVLKAFVRQSRRLALASKAGPDYLEILRFIGLSFMVLALIAVGLILRKHWRG